MGRGKENMADQIHKFLEKYFVENGLHRGHQNVRYVQFSLSNNAADDNFPKLYSGKKYALFRIKQWFASQNITLPEIDDIVVLTGYYGEPRAVVKLTQVEIVAYKDLTKEMALAAGVADGSVEAWKKSRHKYIEADCNSIDIIFNEDIEIMAAWFDLLHPK